jgi:transcriptional regulator with XRE-family HTH domain
VDPYFEFVRWRRRELALTQPDLARKLGVQSNGFISRMETGDKAPGAALRKKLDRLLALGERRGTRNPVYVLAHVREDGSPLLLENRGRIGYFADRDFGDNMSGLLRTAGAGRWTVVPAWSAFVLNRPSIQLDDDLFVPTGPIEENAVAVATTLLDFIRGVGKKTAEPERVT